MEDYGTRGVCTIEGGEVLTSAAGHGQDTEVGGLRICNKCNNMVEPEGERKEAEKEVDQEVKGGGKKVILSSMDVVAL